MVVRVDENGYAQREGSQVEICGNDRYVSVSRREFKEVFLGGKRVKLIDAAQVAAKETTDNAGAASQAELLP